MTLLRAVSVRWNILPQTMRYVHSVAHCPRRLLRRGFGLHTFVDMESIFKVSADTSRKLSNVAGRSKLSTVKDMPKKLHRRHIDSNCTAEQAVDLKAALVNLPETDVFGSYEELSTRNSNSFKECHKSYKSDSVAPMLESLPHSVKHKTTSLKNDETYMKPSELNWQDKFGLLSTDVDEFLSKHMDKRYADDRGEEDESEKPYVRLSATGRKHYQDWYGRKIANLGRAGKVYEAMEMLEKQMLKEDRVFPNQYVFTVLIGVLGRVGFTKKAFQLFNQMKKFGLKPQDPTYTALFNACSNSPWPDDGLQRANDLRRLLADQEYVPNVITYNAMIKAYALCGDIWTAFAVADEALAAGHKLEAISYCSVLMACIGEKDSGLKLALQVWRLMKQKRIKPGKEHYNLLLRAIRDCGIGDAKSVQELLQPMQNPVAAVASGTSVRSCSDAKSLNKDDEILATVNNIDPESALTERKVTDDHPGTELEIGHINGAPIPDLLDPRSLVSNSDVQLHVLETPDSRLGLIGGLTGVLRHMGQDEAKPDIKTFTLLLDLVPSSAAAEEELLAAMKLYSLKPDVDMCNRIIRKRNLRRDFDGAQEVLSLMKQLNLKSNIRTFGCLAMGCPTKADAKRLLHSIEMADMAPNVEICDILLYQSNMDFSYKLFVLDTMRSFNVRPNRKFVERLELDVLRARQMVIKKENDENVPAYFASDAFLNSFRIFKKRYPEWLQSMELEPEIHPWSKFRQPTPSLAKMNVTDEAETLSTVH